MGQEVFHGFTHGMGIVKQGTWSGVACGGQDGTVRLWEECEAGLMHGRFRD